MLRIIAGVVIGFVVWSILWTGSDALLSALSPGWYGRHLNEFQSAVDNRTDYTADSTMLILGLIRSVIFSLVAGYIAAAIARENVKSTVALGILLVLFGAFIQSILWNYLPLWYHIPFLLMLIPMTIAGGKLKRNYP
jgi:uncharacterized membrane protein YeaQ/YmgE (transglycosylase-associated protein family)